MGPPAVPQRRLTPQLLDGLATPSSENRERTGVIERLFRMLKEQIVHGRIFRAIDEVRDAVRAFAARHNAERLVEKNRHRSPLELRAA